MILHYYSHNRCVECFNMKNWKCETCGRYIRVKPEKIEKNSKVVFRVCINSRCHSKSKAVIGKVLERKGDFFYIVCGVDFYYVNFKDLYPINAPVEFIYNMFGECYCD